MSRTESWKQLDQVFTSELGQIILGLIVSTEVVQKSACIILSVAGLHVARQIIDITCSVVSEQLSYDKSNAKVSWKITSVFPPEVRNRRLTLCKRSISNTLVLRNLSTGHKNTTNLTGNEALSFKLPLCSNRCLAGEALSFKLPQCSNRSLAGNTYRQQTDGLIVRAGKVIKQSCCLTFRSTHTTNVLPNPVGQGHPRWWPWQ